MEQSLFLWFYVNEKNKLKEDEKPIVIPFAVSVIIDVGVVKRATTFDFIPLIPFRTAHIATEEL